MLPTSEPRRCRWVEIIAGVDCDVSSVGDLSRLTQSTTSAPSTESIIGEQERYCAELHLGRRRISHCDVTELGIAFGGSQDVDVFEGSAGLRRGQSGVVVRAISSPSGVTWITASQVGVGWKY